MRVNYNKFLQSILALLALIVVLACSQGGKKLTADNEICGLASPLIFNSDTLTFYPSDYFTHPENIDSIILPPGIQNIKILNNGAYQLYRTANLAFLSELIIRGNDGLNYAVIIKNNKTTSITLKYSDDKHLAKLVKIKGTMNFWSTQLSKMEFKENGWQETFQLSPGEYQYLIVVDGKENVDAKNPFTIDNNMGGRNSVLKVGKYKAEDLPFIHTVKFTATSLQLQTNKELTEVFAYWQNFRVPVKLNNKYLELTFPKNAKKLKRSFIRVYAYNNDGFSNDILVPLEYGKVVTNSALLNRSDRETMILYFMMVDRFFDGNTLNNKPLNDPQVLPKANYFGGDIEGINQIIKAGYFKKLGVNSLWISPIMKNPDSAYGNYPDPKTRFSAYHGYWPVSLTQIDDHFGTKDDFKQLVTLSHSDSMNVLLDYVAHHVHENSAIFKDHPNWVTNLYLPDGTLNTEKFDEYRLTTWFDTFLPTIDTRRQEIIDPLTDSALFWVKNYQIDGFRHDATKHIDLPFWRTLNHKLKLLNGCNSRVYQIGETYGSTGLIASYVGSGLLDGQFDFNVYDDAVAVFAHEGESVDRLKNSLGQSLGTYGYHNLMGYISGNQDRPRFISLAGGDLKFNEDTKLAGWKRNIGVGDSLGYEKLKLLQAFNLTIPGIPVIYYGDEIGIPGGNDPDNRRWMKFESLNAHEQDVLGTVTKLTHLRRNSMALQYGDLQFLESPENILVYCRYYFNEKAIVCLNTSNLPKTFTVSVDTNAESQIIAQFGSPVSKLNNGIQIQVPPYAFEIITITTP